MGVRLNNNIATFDIDTTIEQITLQLLGKSPDYIVLRRPRQETGRFWFYVFTSQELLQRIQQCIGQVSGSTFPHLLDCLPQLRESGSAPVVPANIQLPRWTDEYGRGNWHAAQYPVAVRDNQPNGVWEPTQSAAPPAASPVTHAKPSILEQLGVDFGKLDWGSLTSSILSHPTRSTNPGDILNRSYGSPSITRDGSGGSASGADTTSAGDGFETLSTPDNKMQEVFPAIEPSSKSPVVGESLTISISLKPQVDTETSGTVGLPSAAPDFVFKLTVHLLCGKESLWDTLEYSQAAGTGKAASFTFTAPDVALDASGNYPEREKLLVVANFYYENRWCGEGQRYLDLRLDDTVTPLRRLPKPAENHWRSLILLEQGAQPPDLLVRIHKTGERTYRWVCLSRHMQFDRNLPADMSLPENAADFVYDLFEQYSRATLNSVKVEEIKGVGEHIYDSTPELFKTAYWALHNHLQANNQAFQNILFITDEPFIPWELMRVADQQRGANIAAEFLSVRHAVGRWVAECSSRLSQQIPVREMVACGSDYVGFDAVYPTLPWVKDELAWLGTQYQAKTVPLKSADVLNFLKTGSAQAVHFACHGQMDQHNPLRSQLIMEDSPDNLRPTVISANEVETGLGKEHPLVFLNACQIGSSGQALSLMTGFPGAFLKAGASAVISPLWTISDEHAKAITEQFYQAAFANPGATLGEILQTIHRQWEDKKHLTFLAYVLYGDPQAKVFFRPANN